MTLLKVNMYIARVLEVVLFKVNPKRSRATPRNGP